MSVFNLNNTKNHLKRKMFFDESVDVARYDMLKYNNFDKLTDKQLSFFWRPQEIQIGRDSKDFKSLNDFGQFLFTSNLSRQIILDSVQGRGPSEAFLPICSIPELEVWIQTWAFFETIHSRSYTHIIRNVYSDPSVLFDNILETREIVDCARDISKYYDDLIALNNNPEKFGSLEHKKALWLCLNAVNALEGIRFYVSFACSWNFAELKTMEGNAKIIKLIARDENLHLAGTQQILKLLPKDDPEFEVIRDEYQLEVEEIYASVIEQEKDWARYLLSKGSIIGLSEKLLCDYIEWIAVRRMKAVGLPTYDLAKGVGSNPLPWTQKWISGSEVQVAPQEVELSSYTIGAIKQDVDENTFKGFKL